MLYYRLFITAFFSLFLSFTNAGSFSGYSYSELARLPEDSLRSLSEAYTLQFLASNNCMHLAYAESFKAYIEVRKGIKPSFTADCGDAWTYFVRGISDYNQGNVNEAELLFSQAREDLRVKDDVPLLASLLQNLGACNQVMGDFNKAIAYYDSAYVLLPEESSWLLRNNIASLHNEMGNYADALFHSEAIINANPNDDYILTLALYNALSANTSMLHLEESLQYFLQLIKRDLVQGREMKSLNILLKYVVVAEEDEWFSVLAEKHRSLILQDKVFENDMEPFVYAAYLHLNSRFDERDFMREVLINDVEIQHEMAIQLALDENLRFKYEKMVAEQRSLRTVISLFILLLLLLISGYFAYRIYSHIKQKRAIKKINPQLSNSQDVQLIKSSLAKSPMGLKALKALLRIDAYMIRLQNKQLALVPEAQLNDREKEVLQLIVVGKYASEIAISLGVTTKYVYNIRSSIKRKLNIPSDISLETWLKQNSQDFIV